MAEDFIEYICPSCGESIQIVVDPTGGREQCYIEDCPVCCNPNELNIHIDRNGEAFVEASST